jgi:HEAT repeat protein
MKPGPRLVPYACALATLALLFAPVASGEGSVEAPPPPLETLLLALESSDPTTREAAAAALSERAERGDALAIAALIPLLHAPDSKVRYHATWGLSRAGAPAVEGLVEAFRAHPEDEGRASIARALGQIGLAAAAAVPEMRAALADSDSRSCGSAAYALGRMRARETLPELVGAYAASRTPSNQGQIIHAIREIGSDQAIRQAHERLVATLAARLASDDREERASAVAAIAGLYRGARGGSEDFPTRADLRTLVPGLIAALDDPDPARVQAALRALTLAGRDARDATPQLARRLTSEADPQTLHAVKEALTALGTPEADRLLAERAAEEALEARIRTRYSIRDHQGQTELLLFRVAGTAQRGLSLSLRFLYPGQVPSAPEWVVVHFESTSREPRFDERRVATWTADGEPVGMGELDRSWARGQNGGVIEQLSGTLDVDAFRRIAAADALSVRIGDASFELAESDRRAFRYFTSKIPAAGPP